MLLFIKCSPRVYSSATLTLGEQDSVHKTREERLCCMQTHLLFSLSLSYSRGEFINRRIKFKSAF